MTAPQSPAPAQSLLDEMAEALELILPMAKGYSPSGQTVSARQTCKKYIDLAEVSLARYRAAKAAEPDIREAASNLAEYYKRSVNVGPGPNPGGEALLWAALHAALAAAQAKEGRDE